MKIGIDIDNTICDTGTYLEKKIYEWDKFNNRETKISSNYKNVYEKYCYNLDEKERFDNVYVPIMQVEANAIKYAAKVIRKLKSEGNLIYLISYRGKFQYDNSLEVSKQWLKKNNILYDEIIIEEWDKGKVCKNKQIDVFIDDEPVHLKQVYEQGIDVIMYSTKYNNYCNDFNRLNSWNDIYEYIKRQSESTKT